ncbi:MAG: glycerophosphodiester phosphodiesterase family protein [Cyclobacteriaceae bacterium]|nr:glycerophosphodiester phosphodiesterase family protein [Cyclobacteriaceae bacterium]
MRLLIASMFISSFAVAQSLPSFDVQGHRGARGLQPENTISAFTTALGFGVTTVELDLAVTKDGQLVVSHEPWMAAEFCLKPDGSAFSQKEELGYNIFEMTYAEVKKWDCGSKPHARFPEQEKLIAYKPLLSDVIVAVENHIKSYTKYEVDYNIEIKSEPESDNKFHPIPSVFSDMVYQLIDQYLPLDRVVIQSFDFRVLKYWHEKYPEIRLAALIENQKSIDENLFELGFIPSIYSPDFKLLTNEKVKYLHSKDFSLTPKQTEMKLKSKLRVIPWTVNEEKDMLVMKEMNVDGFITDYPNRAAKYEMTLSIMPEKNR